MAAFSNVVLRKSPLASLGDYDYEPTFLPESRSEAAAATDDEDDEPRDCMRCVGVVQERVADAWRHNRARARYGAIFVLLVLFHVYLALAMTHDFDKAVALLTLTVIGWLGVTYFCVLKPLFGDDAYTGCYLPLERAVANVWKYRIAKWTVYLAVVTAVSIFLAIDTRNDRSRLVPLSGIFLYILLLFVFSTNPAKVKWRPVFWGLFLQFIMALFMLRWQPGAQAFYWASQQIVAFLDYTKAGTVFVFGFVAEPPPICGMEPVFAFSALQTVIFFGSIVAVLYYTGVIQAIMTRIAWVMQFTMDTTATESLNAAACIFLGQSEAPLLIKPYLMKMTRSELHAVMASGYSCVAGSLLSAYIAFGACPIYLISASAMSAPAALAVSKLFCPETERSHLKKLEDLELPPGDERNALEAISNGAVTTIELVAAIIANLLVFLALLAFVDNLVEWMAGMLGYSGWSFERLIGYVFFPFAFVMGASDSADWSVRVDESMTVARLMGTKTVLNEFIAYKRLGVLVANGQISNRAQMVATYALCGFSNISSIGIQLGILGGICPQKRHVFSAIVVRALIAGSIACFMTACIAGILIETPIACPPMGASGRNCTRVFN